MNLDNFFKRTLRKREQEAGTQPAPRPPKKPEEGATQGDFFYGTSDDLRKKRK